MYMYNIIIKKNINSFTSSSYFSLFFLPSSWSRYIFIENEKIGAEPGAGWKNGAFSRESTRKSPKSFFMVSWWRVVNFILDVGFRRFARSTAHSHCKALELSSGERPDANNHRSIKSQKKPKRGVRGNVANGRGRGGEDRKRMKGRIREKGFAVAKRNGRQLISREILLLPLIFRAKLPTVDVRLGKSPYTWIRTERVASDTAFRASPSPPTYLIDISHGSLCFSVFTMLRNSRRKFGSNEVLERNVRSI